MKYINIIFIFAYVLVGGHSVWAQNKSDRDTVTIKVVDDDYIPLYGVHVILKPGDILLSSTNDKGEVKIPMYKLQGGTKLQLSSIGYGKETVQLGKLNFNYLIRLKTESLRLDEVVVHGMKTEDILEQAQKNKERSKRKLLASIYERYYGDAQYMKMIECFGQAVEFRREYGCFLTTGNVKRNEDYSPGDINYMFRERNLVLKEAKEICGEEYWTDIFEPDRRTDLLNLLKGVLERLDAEADSKNKATKYRYDMEVFDKFDLEYDFSFVPAYSQCSFPMDMLCEDTLPVLYNNKFDAGSNKLFIIMRCIYLYAPIFSSVKNFNFKMVNPRDENDCYVIDFRTKMNKYSRYTSMFSTGTLWIDISTQKLTKMKFNNCFYHLYRLIERTAGLPPYNTAVVAEFAYDEDNVCYIESCKSITSWLSKKELEGQPIVYTIESPSRPLAAEVGLREIEGLRVYSFKKIPIEQQNEEIGADARLANQNSAAEYKSEVFDSLPYLWNCADALAQFESFYADQGTVSIKIREKLL